MSTYYCNSIILFDGFLSICLPFEINKHLFIYYFFAEDRMASKAVPAQHVTPFEFELYEDPDHLRTVVASSSQLTPGIDPAKLKLRHRIGRGPFGDVWLATHHQSTEDYDECHEVAVKMLHLIKEEHMRVVLDKFDTLFLKCQGIENVCFLHGISVINGKVSWCLHAS